MSETAYRYDMPPGPSSADYLVQGINSYFTEKKAKEEKALEDENKLMQVFANSKMLRKAKSGEEADFTRGKAKFVIDGGSSVKDAWDALKSQADAIKAQKEAGTFGTPLNSKSYEEAMTNLRQQASQDGLVVSATDWVTISDALKKHYNGESVDVSKLNLNSEGGKKLWGVSIPQPVTPSGKNIFSKAGQAVSAEAARIAKSPVPGAEVGKTAASMFSKIPRGAMMAGDPAEAAGNWYGKGLADFGSGLIGGHGSGQVGNAVGGLYGSAARGAVGGGMAYGALRAAAPWLGRAGGAAMAPILGPQMAALAGPVGLGVGGGLMTGNILADAMMADQGNSAIGRWAWNTVGPQSPWGRMVTPQQ